MSEWLQSNQKGEIRTCPETFFLPFFCFFGRGVVERKQPKMIHKRVDTSFSTFIGTLPTFLAEWIFIYVFTFENFDPRVHQAFSSHFVWMMLSRLVGFAQNLQDINMLWQHELQHSFHFLLLDTSTSDQTHHSNIRQANPSLWRWCQWVAVSIHWDILQT